MTRFSTAGIIIIGDEILKGQTLDTNTNVLCKVLFDMGIKVKRTVTIGDKLDEIAQEVKSFSKNYDFVFTSGGVGATHDDITLEAIAKSFNVPLHYDEQLVKICSKFFHIPASDLSLPTFRLAYVPANTKLTFVTDAATKKPRPLPILSINNVYPFPGIPQLFSSGVQCLPQVITASEGSFISKRLYLTVSEFSLVEQLNQVVAKFKDVEIGSYPKGTAGYYKVMLTFQSTDESLVDAAMDDLKSKLSTDVIVDFDQFPLNDLVAKFDRLKSESFVRKSLSVLEECYSKFKPEEVCLSFNGGKDCTAVLHLMKYFKMSHNHEDRLKLVHFRDHRLFPEIDKFIEESTERYGVDIYEYYGPLKHGLGKMKEEHPELKAIVMGSRNTDPNGSNESFAITDSDWPQIIRVNPVLEWSYGDVWKIIRSLFLPYCSLYDKGYTSLGSTNTQPNSALLYGTSANIALYRPAYELEDWTLERSGRRSASKY